MQNDNVEVASKIEMNIASLNHLAENHEDIETREYCKAIACFLWQFLKMHSNTQRFNSFIEDLKNKGILHAQKD